MKKVHLLFLIMLSFSLASLNAQDIVRTKNDTIEAKVLEIGIEEIKYREFNNLNGPVIVIAKSDVIEITYENGSKYFIAPDPYDVNKEVAIRGKSKVIKFEFFSPLTNDIAFGYESMIKVGTNLEFKVGIIGPGTRPNVDHASGIFVKGGIKFLKTPNYVMKGMKFSHQLSGAYIKPELIFNTYTMKPVSYGYNNYPPYNPITFQSETIRNTNICINIVFGKQYILGNAITLDYYVGIGYGFLITDADKLNSLYGYDSSYESYQYSHSYFGEETPLIITGGLTIGVPF